MSILTASNVGHSFGAFDLFSNISVSIPKDGKVGLVGPNGIGKTTLLLILAGLNKPTAGSVHRARGTRLGYLPQEATQAFAGQAHSVYEEMLALFADLRREEARLRQMEADMAAGNASDELMEKYGAALEQFELAGGYDYELRIQQVLDGLGFGQENWGLPLNHLSGGQKTRTLLARLLLEKPDLLILDEPTNHLDVAAVEWLEQTLKMWDGAILLVSHDRYFLDRVANTIWEMGRNTIESYRGNYSAYLGQRQERWEQRRQVFAAEKERLEKELDYIRRNIAGQRTQAAKGKLSRISRELDAIQRGGGLEAIQGKSWAEVSGELLPSRHTMSVAEAAQAIKSLQRPDGVHRTFQVRLKASRRSGNIVLRTKNLTVGYPGRPLFTAEDIELHRLECAALIGPNGSGKTTFLRTLLGQQPPLTGAIQLGASLEIGYFAQAHEQLNPANSVIDELTRHHPMFTSEARNYLGRYFFREDDVFKPVSALSGGERGRLALAILALQNANFLLLDEPTNHLDIPAQEMLQEVLEQFEGTILLVSHDRYLVDRLATQIWSLEDGRLAVFRGPYQEYLAGREQEREVAREAVAGQRGEERRAANQARAGELASKKRAERLAQLEEKISVLETTLDRLSQHLQKASEKEAFDKIQSLGIEYAETESQLEALIQEWENLAREQTLA
ncbi:MAG: ABC-F family ATP-binding cassette domain-containing protein [Chloroflexi bacterium]|nr:ABC-F family ATP-binding cassette domain-containing protein [Chloroflexota bacterium]MCI0727308.1 ABC-F family ATP-binding cassette domain-containing protein [Chloroflexota bacterium]